MLELFILGGKIASIFLIPWFILTVILAVGAIVTSKKDDTFTVSFSLEGTCNAILFAITIACWFV